jgi:hypothetical protein
VVFSLKIAVYIFSTGFCKRFIQEHLKMSVFHPIIASHVPFSGCPKYALTVGVAFPSITGRNALTKPRDNFLFRYMSKIIGGQSICARSVIITLRWKYSGVPSESHFSPDVSLYFPEFLQANADTEY